MDVILGASYPAEFRYRAFGDFFNFSDLNKNFAIFVKNIDWII